MNLYNHIIEAVIKSIICSKESTVLQKEKMDINKKNQLFEALNIVDTHAGMLLTVKKETGAKIFGCTCPVIPPEIPAAFNILLLKIPEFVLNSADLREKYAAVYDAIILPECSGTCSHNPFPSVKSFSFSFPPGWGEDASVALHNSFEKMLRTLCGINIREINIGELQKRTAVYEALRRALRGINAAKNEKPGIISSTDLFRIFETALVLPPDRALQLITPILEWMRSEKPAADLSVINAMLYGGRLFPHELADQIESMGINVSEDDSCTGRRCFDLSVNAESEYLFYELLDAYSYRPLTPCLRGPQERHELLYRLLRNHGIETVIITDEGDCEFPPGHIDYLRIRLMRDGIDPLIITPKSLQKKISDYLEFF